MSEKVCLFCGDPSGRLTREHVLSRSISNLLDLPPVYTVERHIIERELPTWSKQWDSVENEAWIRKAYCETCNSGWMQQIDVEIIPILTPLAAGESVKLSIPDQLQLCSWLTKMALTFASLKRDNSSLGISVYREFYEKREPSPDSLIVAARYSGRNWQMYGDRPIKRRSFPENTLLGVDGICMTLCFRQLLCKAVLWNPEHVVERKIVETPSGAILFPRLGGEFSWPPQVNIDDSSFPEFTFIEPHVGFPKREFSISPWTRS